MIVSGIVVRPFRVDGISRDMALLKEGAKIRREKEIKWTTYKAHQTLFYDAITAYFGALVATNSAHFHALIFDNHSIDSVTYPGATNTSVLSRMYYQLILHRCLRLYGAECDIHIRPDASHELKDLPGLTRGLNNDARRRFGLHRDPIRDIKPQDSSKSPMLQLNDIILGGIAYIRNGRNKEPTAAKHKCEMAKAIQRNLEISDYSKNTPLNNRVTIWNFRSSINSGPRP